MSPALPAVGVFSDLRSSWDVWLGERLGALVTCFVCRIGG